ncbi:SUPT6H [Cordylochernes scorpioides]|uniref:SUPT6H n=1 Tax=Cordylochernes scorpioides TaxID=51811 RepID=A0ABY6K9T2_9ARAC|nr:SUPT6H [Cordylochernes scorpioides]
MIQGQSRAQVVTQLLQELNSDVRGDFVEESTEHLLESNPSLFHHFSIVIATGLAEKTLLNLAHLLWEANVPLLVCRTYGMIGYLRIQFQEHPVVEAHPDSQLHDLRLDKPFPALMKFVESQDLAAMDKKVSGLAGWPDWADRVCGRTTAMCLTWSLSCVTFRPGGERMADFLEDEAEVSSAEEDSEDEIGRKKRVISSDEDEEETVKPKSKKRKVARDDDDEEDEDEEDLEKLREEMKDLINDEEEEEEEEEDEEDKRKRHEELDHALEEDDYDLIEENLGVKVSRKKKFRRLKQFEDDESDQEESRDSTSQQAENDREAISKKLFSGGDEEEDMEPEPRQEEERLKTTISSSEGESDEDDFIVDDNGQPITKGKKRHVKYNDAALQEAQDIFGADFNYDDFMEEEYEEEIDEEEYEAEDETVPRKPKKGTRKKQTKKSIFDVYEPSELERGHFTDLDIKIKSTDIPERFQLRGFPVKPAGDMQISNEAQWIYNMAFYIPTISQQDVNDQTLNMHQPLAGKKKPSAVPKIREALKFIRNQHLEVPFIAFYRKEYVEPDLNINDLWTVYKWDEKWCQLRRRKRNLRRLLRNMRNYQHDVIVKNSDKPLDETTRLIKSEDFQKLKEAQNFEELNDIYLHFLLYYNFDINGMREFVLQKRKEDKERKSLEKETTEEGVEPREKKQDKKAYLWIEEEDSDDDESDNEEDYDALDESLQTKKACHKNFYSVGLENSIHHLVKMFGLSAEHFGENLRDNYQRHEVEQYPADPQEAAAEYICNRYPNAGAVLEAARYMAAMQLSKDPLVRKVVRQVYQERACISVKPTKKGLKEIDENHPCYTYRYLRNKPIRYLNGEMFLQIHLAQEEGLLEFQISMEKQNDMHIYLEEIKQLYFRDEFSKTVQEWNTERYKVLSIALDKYLFPVFEKEIKNKLVQEAKDGILKMSCRKLYNMLKVAPYQVDQLMEEDEEYDTRDGIRVLGIAYVSEMDVPAFGALVDGNGEVTDHIRLPHLLKRRSAWRPKDREQKESDLRKLRSFIAVKKPHVIVVGGENRDALMIVDDLKNMVNQLMESDQMPAINVELLDNDLAKIYMNSNKAENDFRDYPSLLRQAVSLARRLQDPLIEFSQLCTADEEILCLKYHPLQDKLSKDDLLDSLYLEFINRTNEVGVDINRAISYPHTSHLVQFICGLGPRKASYIFKELKQSRQRFEARPQIVHLLHIGPKVFINCAGFIKIDTSSLGDSSDVYTDVLDGSRVHPEAYEWARKMAVDALEYDDSVDDINPAGAIDDILENPEKLKDLDLDAFAEELERQSFGNKSITLYDIRAELNHRYKDLRTPFRPATAEETFNMLTKETPQTFYIGKLVLATITGIARKKAQGEQLDSANPIRHDETGLWQCPFCLKNDFPELSEVWSHFDAGSCPGKAIGVRTRLDNGVSGFIPTKFLSDQHVRDPEERVKNGMIIHCRIMKINIERFSVDLTCRSSDLLDKNGDWKPNKDQFYDFEAEEKDRQIHDDAQKKQGKHAYIKRVIVHPSFHNINFKESEEMLSKMDQGDLVIRPSSKAVDHLTLTWKVCDKIHQHVDIREEGKEKAYSLGRSLWIKDEEFEDLDEIIARHIQPMAAYAREVINFKYFKQPEKRNREEIEALLMVEKKQMPSKIHYLITPSYEYPGKFLLSYLPRVKCRHEYFTVTNEGLRYRDIMFPSLNQLLKYFKEHFRDPIHPTMSTRTPVGHATPSLNLSTVDAQTIQRAAANIPNHVFQQLTQVAGQQTPLDVNSYYQPYTPSQPLTTPLMTPSYVPTPRYIAPITPTTNPLSAEDWKRMAEQWAKNRNPIARRTPITAAPDATPLIDES